MSIVRTAEIMLDPHPASVGRARRWLSSQLEEWGLEDLDYDASVVLSELVTNSLLHAKTQIELKLSHGQVLRLEVCDSSETLPALRGPTESSTTGRGLHLVAALTTAWGFESVSGGKTVWAEFGGDDDGETEDAPSKRSGLGTITPIAGRRRAGARNGVVHSQRRKVS